MVDHYATLGVSRRAKKHEIKEAYRRLALKLHPDKNLGSPAACAAFQRLLTAYEELHDDHRRAIYDTLLDEAMLTANYKPGDSPTRPWTYHDHSSQKTSWQHRSRREAKMRQAHSDQTWPEREQAALARIARAKTNVAAVKADIGAWKLHAKQRRKQERQAQPLWKHLAEPFLKTTAAQAESRAREREERVYKMGGMSVRLGFARMELERCKEALGAMRRMRGQVGGEGWWEEERWGEEERQMEGDWCWDANVAPEMQGWMEEEEEAEGGGASG